LIDLDHGPLVLVNDAAAQMNLDPAHVRRLAREGKLRAAKWSGRIFLDPSDVAAYRARPNRRRRGVRR